jgi:hypothetical protein
MFRIYQQLIQLIKQEDNIKLKEHLKTLEAKILNPINNPNIKFQIIIERDPDDEDENNC